MARVSHAEHPARRIAGHGGAVVRPQGDVLDLDVDRVVADQAVGDAARLVLVDLRRRLADVVAPDEQPLVPGPDHPNDAHPDAADRRARLEDPVQDAGPVLDQVCEVRPDQDVHAAGDAHLTLERQSDVLGHFAAASVRAEEVLGADLRDRIARPVPDGRGDALAILLEREVLGVESHLRSARRGGFEQDRLEERLGQVAHARRARELVVGSTGRVGAPRAHPRQLLAGEARAEHLVAHQGLRRRLGDHLVLESHVAQDLDRPLVGDVRARRVSQPAVALDEHVGDAVLTKEQCG